MVCAPSPSSTMVCVPSPSSTMVCASSPSPTAICIPSPPTVHTPSLTTVCATSLFLEAEPDHVDALGLDDEGVLASMQMCSNKWLSPDGPQEQPLSTPRVDVEFADLGEVHDHCNIDEEEVTLEGGHFSKEEHAGIDEIYQNILALAKGFGKKHCQSVQCVLTKLSMGFAS